MSLGGVGVRMARRFEVRLLMANCKGCGICAHYCPAGVLEMSDEFTPRGYHPPRKKEGVECMGCRNCELMCPDFGIFIEEMGQDKAEAAGKTAPVDKETKGGPAEKGRGPAKRRKAGKKGGRG